MSKKTNTNSNFEKLKSNSKKIFLEKIKKEKNRKELIKHIIENEKSF